MVEWLELGGIPLGKLCSRILVCLLLFPCAHLSCVDTTVSIWMELWHQASLPGFWTNFPVKCWAVVFKQIRYICQKKELTCIEFYFKTQKFTSICFWKFEGKSYMENFLSVALRLVRIRCWIFLALKQWLLRPHVQMRGFGCSLGYRIRIPGSLHVVHHC